MNYRTDAPETQRMEVSDNSSLPSTVGSTDRSIGRIMQAAKDLTEAQIAQILEHQRKYGMRFGEAAVSLHLATAEEVTWALSKQFQYPYSPGRFNNNPELVVAADPFGDMAENFRDLRSSLSMGILSPTSPRQALAVVSTETKDGRSFVAANLAVSFSQLGCRTLLVDADMRRPRVHDIFGVANNTGLSSLLSNQSHVDVIKSVEDLPGLFVLPVGAIPPNPLELVERPAFSHLLLTLLPQFDQVIIDTPASEMGADARVIASRCGATLAISRKGKTSQQKLQQLIRSLSKTSTQMAGVVMNDHDF
ncbi:receptor protein-tyrosine kinase [Sphaerotilus hippei]|uniref:Receptor protein-tyrosine kinase n=1 Tax=Sphaerotilus hippei TaxID=744406 RepID=A0A318H2X9_9BURK|nr:polysaccharide biosynthesis tyrosine autokinase [Sphaerotilus hippei]PXW97149.1 receptor protein-tyrosine kinase [Sphaerotilus hippei]